MSTLKLTIEFASGAQPRSMTIDRPQVTLGRSSRCDIRLPFATVSSHHLSFVCRDGEYCVADMGSTNGTMHQEQRLAAREPIAVRDGMELRIVDITIRLNLLRQFEGGFTLAESATMMRQLVGDLLSQNDAADGELAFLEILHGPGCGRRTPIPDTFGGGWIGSQADSFVTLNDPSIPAQALELTLEDDGFAITPAASSSEILLNGEPVLEMRVLESEDRIKVGSVELVFYDPLQDYMEALDEKDVKNGQRQNVATQLASELEGCAAVIASQPQNDEALEPQTKPQPDAAPASPTRRWGLFEIGLLAGSVTLIIAALLLVLMVLEII